MTKEEEEQLAERRTGQFLRDVEELYKKLSVILKEYTQKAGETKAPPPVWVGVLLHAAVRLVSTTQQLADLAGMPANIKLLITAQGYAEARSVQDHALLAAAYEAMEKTIDQLADGETAETQGIPVDEGCGNLNCPEHGTSKLASWMRGTSETWS